MGDLTSNFNRREFACKGQNCCGGGAPVSMRLVTAIQVLRDRAGRPLAVKSGFRCPKYNAGQGGNARSPHLYGTAADIAAPAGLTPRRLLILARNTGLFDGVKLCKGGVHVEVGGLRR